MCKTSELHVNSLMILLTIRFVFNQVRKVEEDGELPGLMIEEMMESASVVR